jgi:hypothetical protein
MFFANRTHFPVSNTTSKNLAVLKDNLSAAIYFDCPAIRKVGSSIYVTSVIFE